MKNRIGNADAIFALCMLLVSVFFFVMGAAFDRPTADGHMNEGFFPRMIAVIVAIFSIIIIINAIRKNKAYFAMDDEQRKSLKPLLISIGLFIAYLALWPFAHFIILTLLLLLIICRLYKLSWKFSGIFSTIFAVGVYFLFTKVFSILL